MQIDLPGIIGPRNPKPPPAVSVLLWPVPKKLCKMAVLGLVSFPLV